MQCRQLVKETDSGRKEHLDDLRITNCGQDRHDRLLDGGTMGTSFANVSILDRGEV